MAPKDEPRPDSAGEGGDDGGIDLGALVARLEQVEETQQVIASRQQLIERRQRAIVETLDRDLRFAAKELRGLLN